MTTRAPISASKPTLRVDLGFPVSFLGFEITGSFRFRIGALVQCLGFGCPLCDSNSLQGFGYSFSGIFKDLCKEIIFRSPKEIGRFFRVQEVIHAEDLGFVAHRVVYSI